MATKSNKIHTAHTARTKALDLFALLLLATQYTAMNPLWRALGPLTHTTQHHATRNREHCKMFSTRIARRIQSTSIIDGSAEKTYKHPNYFSAIKQFDKKRLKKIKQRRHERDDDDDDDGNNKNDNDDDDEVEKREKQIRAEATGRVIHTERKTESDQASGYKNSIELKGNDIKEEITSTQSRAHTATLNKTLCANYSLTEYTKLANCFMV